MKQSRPKAQHLLMGEQAEDRALAYLNQHGLRLITRNFRCRMGEIDLIMADDNEWVFVEVRYRKTACFGSALESVDKKKQQRLIRCATYYLTTYSIDKPSRFDVVALSPNNGQLTVQWVTDAFQAEV